MIYARRAPYGERFFILSDLMTKVPYWRAYRPLVLTNFWLIYWLRS